MKNLFATCAVAIFSLLIAGCPHSPSESELYPIAGQITYREKPVAEAMVVFHRQQKSTEPNAESFQQPMSITDAEGKFEITTFQPADGASAGEYAVTVELRQLRDDGGGEMIRDGKNLLPSKYQNPQTTALHVTVKPEVNEMIVLKLK